MYGTGWKLFSAWSMHPYIFETEEKYTLYSLVTLFIRHMRGCRVHFLNFSVGCFDNVTSDLVSTTRCVVLRWNAFLTHLLATLNFALLRILYRSSWQNFRISEKNLKSRWLGTMFICDLVCHSFYDMLGKHPFLCYGASLYSCHFLYTNNLMTCVMLGCSCWYA